MASLPVLEDSTIVRLVWRPHEISETAIKMSLEERLIRAHLALRVAPEGGRELELIALARYGGYEVRLVEPEQDLPDNRFDFWLELFDIHRKISVDSGGANDLERALAIAEEFVSRAKELNAK
jgi:hypothetical protein